jgi:NAD(P)-dependent dehydrogenase (short-subunit alcohol dehydrogenase family)
MKTNTNRRVALITGANRGIGLQTAKDLGPDGVILLLGVRDLVKAGRIVNVSSIMGSLTLHADPSSPIYHSSVFAYNTSKAALNSFTVHLAYEVRNTSIKVNSAHPGWVKTEMGGENAELEVSEGGRTSAWLATLPEDGPSGGYFHAGEPLPW